MYWAGGQIVFFDFEDTVSMFVSHILVKAIKQNGLLEHGVMMVASYINK